MGIQVLHRIRLGLIVFLAVLCQTVIFPKLRILGATPSLAVVAVLAEGYREGPEAGATFGFLMGLAIDLFLPTPFGLSALTFAIAGYAIGVLQTGMLRASVFLAPLLGGLGSLLVGLLFVSIVLLIGQDQFLAVRTLQVLLVSSLYSAALAPVLFPLIGWAAAHENDVAEPGWSPSS